MLRLAIFLILIKTSFAGDFLSEIKSQYQSIFAGSLSDFYTKDFHERLPQYGQKTPCNLLPPMILPHQVDIYTNNVFGIHHIDSRCFYSEETKKDGIRAAEEKFKNAHVDLIRAYWQGYIAFLEELNQPGAWDRFAENFLESFHIPSFNYLNTDVIVHYYNEDRNERLTESNKHELLPIFFVHYALGTFFSESKKVTPQMRIKALQIFKRRDPELKFMSIPSYLFQNKYGYVYGEKRKNLLPETFDEGLIEDQEIKDSRFYENPKIVKIFTNHEDWTQETFQRGLNILLTDHKQEFIQVLHSLIQLNFSKIYGSMALRFLFKITDSDDLDFLGILLGEHASF